jgi:hypothetical protein
MKPRAKPLRTDRDETLLDQFHAGRLDRRRRNALGRPPT